MLDYFQPPLPFRDLDANNLKDLPPGIFDSLISLSRLYVLSLFLLAACFFDFDATDVRAKAHKVSTSWTTLFS